jgi:hypothetical protein
MVNKVWECFPILVARVMRKYREDFPITSGSFPDLMHRAGVGQSGTCVVQEDDLLRAISTPDRIGE